MTLKELMIERIFFLLSPEELDDMGIDLKYLEGLSDTDFLDFYEELCFEG